MLCFISDNIHEKISPFWLVKSSAVFFETSAKRRNKLSILIGQWSKKLTDGQSNEHSTDEGHSSETSGPLLPFWHF